MIAKIVRRKVISRDLTICSMILDVREMLEIGR